MARKFWFVCSAIAALLISSVQTQAAVQLVNGPGEYEDTDYESQVSDGGVAGKLDAGDLLLAVFAIDNQVNKYSGTANGALDGSITGSPAFTYDDTTDMLTGVSMLKVKSVTIVGGVLASYVFEAPTAAEWLAATGKVVTGDDTTILVYDDPAASPHLDPTSIATGLATATDGTLLWEFGLVGAGTFWQADSVDTDAPFDPTNPLDINVLNFFAALNLISGTGLDGHNLLGDPDIGGTNAGLFTSATHLQLQGNLQPGSTGGFQLRTDTNVYLSTSAVPEPASMLVWAGLAGIGAFVRYRRKK